MSVGDTDPHNAGVQTGQKLKLAGAPTRPDSVDSHAAH